MEQWCKREAGCKENKAHTDRALPNHFCDKKSEISCIICVSWESSDGAQCFTPVDFMRQASRTARNSSHTDTDELLSILIRRLANMDDDDRFEDTQEFRAYSGRMMSNAAIDCARKQGRRLARETEYALLRQQAGTNKSLTDNECEQKTGEVIEENLMLNTGECLLMTMHAKGMTTKQISVADGLEEALVRKRIQYIRDRVLHAGRRLSEPISRRAALC